MKPAENFYFKLYLFWVLWVSLNTLVYTALISFSCALFVYLSKGFPALNSETFSALWDISIFCFPFAFSLSFIVMLLFVFKRLFTTKINGQSVKLYDCKDEPIAKPLLSDVTMLWRKWLFVTVWVLLIFCVIFLGLWRLITGELPPLGLLNGITLYLLVMLFGGPVFVLGVKRCKKIRISDE